MKVLKEDFIQENPTVEIKQTPEGTDCIFERESLAGLSSSNLSELGYPISQVKMINNKGKTGYSITVIGTKDPRQVIELLQSYGCLILLGV